MICETCEEETEKTFIFSPFLQKKVCEECYRVFEYGFDETIAESEEWKNLRKEYNNNKDKK